MKYFHFILLLFFLQFYSFSQDNIEVDSNAYPWYSPSLNYFQFYSKNSISNFYDALQNVKKNKVSIIHFGDSHIQSEIPTNETRILLQKKYGNGGRGIVFPYSTAKTYSSIHYSTKHSGNWSYTKSTKPSKEFPLGIMGMSAKTIDSVASFTITFNSKIPSNNNILRIFCENDSLSYDLIIESDGKSTPIDVFTSSNSIENGTVLINLPSVSNSVTVKCLKSNANQKQFIIHGIELLSTDNNGIIYYTSGVGGAKFNSLKSIDNLNKQLKTISPDIVFLDFGTNDFLFSDSLKPNLEDEIKSIISQIRKTSPLVSIILFSTQDLFYKQKNLNSTEDYEILLKKIAKETETGFWDWFQISGGKSSLKVWLNQGLAKNDMIHLTNSGYRIKGKLLFDAIEKTKEILIKTPNQDELIIANGHRKIETIENVNLNNQNITTLSNRELTNIEKKDTLLNLNFQNQIITKDSIISNQSVKPTIKNDSITTQESTEKSKTAVLTQSESNIKLDTIFSKPTDSIKPIITQINLTNKVDSTMFSKQPKTSADIFRTHSETNVTTNKPTSNSNKNIKVELFEDFNDSTVIDLENKKIYNTKTQTKKTKKNYEIARERQHQILDHDTIALKIVSDSLPKTSQKLKPVVKTVVKPKNINYKVRNGDNLSFIAEKFNVKVSEIKAWNKLSNDNLSLGQTLIIKR